ncbi:MAG TPA: O-antigen ligase family protein [Pyrinomonadaceae bacterium]|nr:O-antigen ligase family protein [Pyrinomonadaceae bacterium]
MQNFLRKFDELAGIETVEIKAKWLERIAFGFLILMFLTAPHSIAASQTAWIAGMFFSLIGFFFNAKAQRREGAKFFTFHSSLFTLHFSLFTFFAWTAVSSVFSYAPDISIDRLRGAAIFLVFYFVIYNLRTVRAVKFLALAMIFSCMVNVIWMPIQRIIGRGVEIHGISPESPLAKALLYEGDALLTANGKRLATPEDLIAQIEQNNPTKITFYRPDFEFFVDVKRENLLAGENALQKLGIESWKKSHNWRSRGFFGHYTTYAEVLQLIASLVFGLFLTQRRKDAKAKVKSKKAKFTAKFFTFYFLLFTFAAMCFALLLTVTRASQLALIVSCFAMVFVLNRKMLLILSAIALPVIIGGLIFLQQSRNVGFFDSKDDSTKYRQTMWRDGLRLSTESPRNFVFGVGMDSVQRYWREWQMFDGGKLPLGHFHSTPVQILVERGFPALLLWLWILFLFGKTFLRYLKLQITNYKAEIGIVLAAFGGLIGFFTSGLAHYNLGDQEVAMVFYILMALGVWISNHKSQISDSEAFQSNS